MLKYPTQMLKPTTKTIPNKFETYFCSRPLSCEPNRNGQNPREPSMLNHPNRTKDRIITKHAKHMDSINNKPCSNIMLNTQPKSLK